MPDIFYVLMICCISVLMSSSVIKRKNNFDKLKLEEKIDRYLPLKKYRVLKQIHLENDDDYFIMDYIILSTYGIFILNVKKYGGTLDGFENEKNWLKISNRNKQNISNPIYENHLTEKRIRKILGSYNKLPVHSIVIFTNDEVDFSHIETNKDLIYEKDLTNVIEKYKKDQYLKEEELSLLYEKLNEIKKL
ncbi:nuclease-related domain-containing protein [Alkaliphilus sp. B6464]|uniref:nuclease-related domain-containing protein n=1 Tax=Alkaliphilus sp. B6464 TaxID=2731219 RepID=UPI001BA9B18B|nr:nuclease-related domain-containing protein [Alkaliphilus sp. B6464]QUH22220.1 NERD domain-containing protein [Alkaliphilus sp. B6464]